MNRRPDILYLVHRVPYPPDRGDRIRSFHVLDFLSQRANVHLAALADEPVSQEVRRALAGRCRNVEIQHVSRRRWLRGAISLSLGRSATEGLFWSPALWNVVRRWGRETQFDAAVAFCSSMAPYLAAPELRHTPTVIDLVDVDSQKWLDYAAAGCGVRRWLYRLEGRRLRQLEAQAARRADAVTLVSEAEAKLFRRVCPNNRTSAVPNGVDLEYFRPTPTAGRADRCVFVGVMDYRPNVDGVCWFVERIWPSVREKLPTATFAIVGRNPDRAVKRLGAVGGVEVIGAVPDVRPHLAEAGLAIAPLRIARGVQNKVLEAMAAGRAVVASPFALEGLAAEPGVHLKVAAEADEWIATLVRLMRDDAARHDLAISGRQYVETRHSWDECLAPLDAMLHLSPQGGAQPVGMTAGPAHDLSADA